MNEQQIPIDINTTKLLDWLISRRHVSKDWQKDIIKIREKINNAIQDMPEHEDIIKLLCGQHINFFHCQKIVEILKETEADTKNLFGRYGSQRMKDWQDILQSYQRDGLYLAEAAQMLIRNVNFEVPSLRKQITKFEQVQLESKKKIKDYNKTESITCNEFNATCKQLGISGGNIKKELLALLNELPQLYEGAIYKIKTVETAVKLYITYLEYYTGNRNYSGILTLLQYVIEHGNTTTYEYKYDKKPVSIEINEILMEDEESKINLLNEIDFGDNSFGKSEIDWSFEIVDHTDVEIDTEKSEVARDDNALTVLDNPKTRDYILNDLLELEAFLSMRTLEMFNDSDLLLVTQLQNAPAILQMQTTETISLMLDNVQNALNELMNKRIQHLHNIKHSPKYVDILTANLNQKLSLIKRLTITKGILEEKIQTARIQAQNVRPVIDMIVKNTKILQAKIEEDISRKYKGRPVNIVGAVNML